MRRSNIFLNGFISFTRFFIMSGLSFVTLGAPSSFALPLLAENASQKISEAVTLYPDSVDANKFYYIPNSSQFVYDRHSGLPSFGFTYWGLTGNGPLENAGAYMVFDVRLASDAGQKAALDAFIASGKSVAVLPFQKSTIGLTSTHLGAAPLARFFDEFNFAAQGGVAETEVGVNAILNGLGAKVFRAAIENPALLKVDYCYMVQGLGPNFDASIDIDWNRVYEDFQTHASIGGFWSRMSVDAEVEKLRDNKIIKIVVNGGDAKDQEYVKAIADRIVDKLFVAELQASPTSSSNSPGWSFNTLSVKYTRREELKTEHWSFVRRDLVERQFCTPLLLSDLGNYLDKVVRDADAKH